MKPSPKTKSLLWLILIAATAVLTWTGLAQHYPETNTLRYLPDRLFRLVKTLTGADPLGSAVEPAAIPASLILAKLLVTLLLIGALYKIIEKVFHEQYTRLPADPDSQRNLETAAELLNAHPHAAYPIHIHGNSKRLAALLDGKARHRLHFFGDDGETCDHELITGNRQDRLARAIHADYLKQSGKLPAHTPSESPAYQTAWDELNEDAQAANRAQADHIPYKLALTGKTAAQPLHFSAEETEALAQSEHRRWAAHRYLNGWQYGATRDDGGKRHPSLIDWEQLDEAEKQKDRDTVNRIAALLAQTGTQDL